MPLGTAGIIASVAPVNDQTAPGLMIRLHRRLRQGGARSEPLRDACGDLDDDPVEVATGMSFLVLGAG